MAIEQRNSFKINKPGPYLGIVRNYLDSTRMGGLEVELIRGYTDNPQTQAGQVVPCSYLSPFYGITSADFIGDSTKVKNFKDTQQSYGMWMVPPDLGTTVMVIFIEGEYNQGYWIGCVPELFQNHMIPGIAAQSLSSTWLSSEEEQLYGTTYLPVAEYNKKQNQSDALNSTESIQKPIHPFAKQLAKQGLLTDVVRGVTSSSARREIPSSVFGISTPGPLDKEGKKAPITYAGNTGQAVPVNRLGGTTFVMDDGAVDESGNITNELVRIRTRTGHQILLHNTDDLIYIANSQGTAWIELTSNGKIDIFAQDSVSIHTEKDFNIQAGNDVNIEAGRNVNIHSKNDIQLETNNDLSVLIRNNAKITAQTELFLNSLGTVSIFGQTDVRTTSKIIHNLASDSIRHTSKKIYNNSPSSAAEQAGISTADPLKQYVLPMRSESAGWANKIYYKNGTITTTVPRVPTHEPWPLHENKTSE
jgi:hypothetical protein